MFDHVTLKEKSDQQIQELIRNIDKAFQGVSVENDALNELLTYHKECLMLEMQERQFVQAFKDKNPAPMNLTTDDLSKSEKEHEGKGGEQGNFR